MSITISQTELLKALWTEVPMATFATGGEIGPIEHGSLPASLQIEGAGRIELPLSQDGLLKIRSVSVQGEQTQVDLQVQRVWQLDAEKVSCGPETPHFFTQTVHDLAATALKQMGVDPHAVMLQVKLYKLLLYEQGGHFKFHRDTEKQDGMFATMIIQLPTQTGHKGGALTVQHGKDLVTLDFSNGSSSGYFQAVLFCDCNHQLEEVTSGSRLCLVFSLVRNNIDFIPADHREPSFVVALSRVRSLLLPWAKQHTANKLAIPLAHQYSEKRLCFAGLKGYDRLVASLICNCDDFLDIHLCSLTKFGESDGENDGTTYTVDKWITTNDQRTELGVWDFDIHNEVLKYESSSDQNEPFNSKEHTYNLDREGNEDGRLVYMGNVAVLVVWPKNRRMEVMGPSMGISGLLEWWRNIPNLEEAGRELHEIVHFYMSEYQNEEGVSNVFELVNNVHAGGQLLGLCLECGLEGDAQSIVQKWRPLALKKNPNRPGYMFDVVSSLSRYFPAEPKLCKNKDAAMVVAKMLCDIISARSGRTKPKAGLLNFCVSAGLKEEATCIIQNCEDIAGKHLVGALLKWPELNAEILTALDGKVEQLAEVAVELEDSGAHEMAVAFAKELCASYDGKVEEYTGLNVLAALLFSEDKMEEVMKVALEIELCSFLATLKKAAGLIGLRDKARQRGMFVKVCLHQLDRVEDLAEAEAMEFLRTVFWFGDERLLEAVEKKLSKMMWLVKVALDKDKGVVRDAMGSSVSRSALKRLVEARIAYLSCEPKQEDNEQVDVVFQDDNEPLRKAAKFWVATKNPRREHLVHDLRIEEWKKNVATELPGLRQLLVDLSAVIDFLDERCGTLV